MTSWLVFDQPWWLLAAALGAAPAVLAVRARRRGISSPAWAVALQCVAVALAGAALSRPAVRMTVRAPRPWLVLRDVSASTRGQDSNLPTAGGGSGSRTGPPRAGGWPAELPRRDVAFAGDILSASAARGAGVFPAAGTAAGGATGEGDAAPAATTQRTRLRPALQLALAAGGELAGAAVVSDGQWQDDDWAPAAEAIRRAGLPLLVVPLADPPPDARVADLSAWRRADGAVDLHVTAAAGAPLARRLTLRREGGAILLARDLRLLPGEGFASHLADAAADRDAVASYTAELSPGDAFPENDIARAAAPPARARAALVRGPGDAAAAAMAKAVAPGGALAGMPLSELAVADAPRSASEWAAFALVVLADPDGNLLDGPRREALAEYVRRGGGLVVVGTVPAEAPPAAGAEGARPRDPLSRLAALAPNPHERNPLRLVVVLDSSGSMGEPAATAPEALGGRPAGSRRKFDVAAEAVASLRGHVGPRDSLAVVVFSDTARRVYDSGGAAPDFAAVREALAKVRPAGPTDVAPALEEALNAAGEPAPGGVAGPAPAREALVIVVSDLAVKPLDVARLAERFQGGGRIGGKVCTLAVVEVLSRTPAANEPEGPAASAPPDPSATAPSFLRRLAERLGAPVVGQEDLAGLAEVFARFVRQARGEIVRRGRFRLVVPGPLFGAEGASLAPAGAYVLSAAREGADVLALVGDDPVIARAPAGAGRCVCLALPAGGENADLLASGGATGLLAGAAAWAARPPSDPRFACEVRRGGGRPRLVVEAVAPADRAELPKLSARAAPLGAEGAARRLDLEQVAPGRCEADLGDAPGGLLIQVLDDGGRAVWSGAAGGAYAEEFAAIGPHWANLRRLAALAGGRIVSPAELPAAGRKTAARQYRPLWPALLAAAVAVMLAEWAGAKVVRRPARRP